MKGICDWASCGLGKYCLRFPQEKSSNTCFVLSGCSDLHLFIQPRQWYTHLQDWFLSNQTLLNCVVLSTYIPVSMRISRTLGMLCIIYNGLDFKSNSYFIILESSGIITLNWLASQLDSSEFTTTGIPTKEMQLKLHVSTGIILRAGAIVLLGLSCDKPET